jgi:hypothetical protein
VAAKAGGWAGAFYWNLGPYLSVYAFYYNISVNVVEFTGFAGSQPGVCGSDSTIKYTLYNCEGGQRGGYNEFKYS